MKGTDKQKMLGAIIGKALDPLPQGTGVIRVPLSSKEAIRSKRTVGIGNPGRFF